MAVVAAIIAFIGTTTSAAAGGRSQRALRAQWTAVTRSSNLGRQRLSLVNSALTANGIGVVDFGLPTGAAVVGLELELNYSYTPPMRPDSAIHGRVIRWRGLSAYFRDGRFVGYCYHPSPRAASLTTSRGLRIGDPLSVGRALYGGAFTWGSSGRSWRLHTSSGVISGSAAGSSQPRSSRIVSMQAGV